MSILLITFIIKIVPDIFCLFHYKFDFISIEFFFVIFSLHLNWIFAIKW